MMSFTSKKSRKKTGFPRHSFTIARVGKQDPFFGSESLRKNQNMGQRTGEGGDPGAMNQGKSEHFHENGGIVWMAHITKRAARDNAHSRRIHDLNTPMVAEGSNHPPANDIGRQKDSEADCREQGIKRAVKKNNFQGRAQQDGGMKENHPAEARVDDFRGAAGHHPGLVTARNAQFVQAQNADDEKKGQVGDDAQFHCSSKNSALKPGPKAAAMACSPVFKGRFSSHS